jgi:hypothetical protein
MGRPMKSATGILNTLHHNNKSEDVSHEIPCRSSQSVNVYARIFAS